MYDLELQILSFSKTKKNAIYGGKKHTLRFLAAMSSSRSDVVTQCVRVSVRVSLFFLLVSLEFYLVLKCFNGVSRVFQECFKSV